MKKYFISVTAYVSKHKLDDMLHEEFRKFDHMLISEDKLEIEFDQRFQAIVKQYQDNKGRAKVHFDRNGVMGDTIIYSLGDSLVIYLYLINGEL